MGEIQNLPLFVKRLVVRAGRMGIWCGGQWTRVSERAHAARAVISRTPCACAPLSH